MHSVVSIQLKTVNACILHALIVKVKYEMHPLQHRRNLSIAFHQIHNFEYVCCMNIHTFSNWNVWVQCDVESTTIVLAQFVAKFRPNCEWKLMNRTTTN